MSVRGHRLLVGLTAAGMTSLPAHASGLDPRVLVGLANCGRVAEKADAFRMLVTLSMVFTSVKTVLQKILIVTSIQ